MSTDSAAAEPLRLVKLRLPAPLVRAMDERIVASRGTYLDRNEFVSEAIWDRLNEDAAHAADEDAAPAFARTPETTVNDAATGRSPAAMTHDPDPHHVATLDADAGADTATDPTRAVAASNPETYLPLSRAVAARDSAPTLPRQHVLGSLFGLHNRDLPTLWITVLLITHANDDHAPVPWATFVNRLRPLAQQTGQALRRLDAEADRPVKAAVGFPKPGAKARTSEDRLISTALGAPTREGATGPAFLLGLVAADKPTDPRPALAPTTEALQLLAELRDDGLSASLPQPEAATHRWLRHIGAVAPDEHDAWLRVLTAVHGKPTRGELVEMFPDWGGSRADTNCTGYISRGREWGLVEPDLTEGRYRLTRLGEHVISEGTHK